MKVGLAWIREVGSGGESAALMRDEQGRERSQICCRSRRRFAAVQPVATVRVPEDSSVRHILAAHFSGRLRVHFNVPD